MQADLGDRFENAPAFQRVSGARCVLDTNVALDLIVFRDPGAAPLARAIKSGGVLPVSSPGCMEELQRVLEYPQFGLDEAGRLEAFERYHELIKIVHVPTGSGALPRCSDPDDQKFLELAWHSRASWLITKDKALLKMRRALRSTVGFTVVTPGDFSSCAPC